MFNKISFAWKSLACLLAVVLVIPALYTPGVWAEDNAAPPGTLFTVIDARGGANTSYYVTESFIGDNPGLRAGPFEYTDINNAGSWRSQTGISGVHLENLFAKLGITGLAGSNLVEFREGGAGSFFRTFTWGYITAPRFSYRDTTKTSVPAIIRDDSAEGDMSALSLIFGQEAPTELTRGGFVSGMKGGTITILSAAADSFAPVTAAPRPADGEAPAAGTVQSVLAEGTQLALIVPGGGSAYFTLDGTEPTRGSYLFNYAPQNSNQNNTAFFWPVIRAVDADPETGKITLKAKVFGADRLPSETASFTYRVIPFTDVKASDWFADSVCFVYGHELMKGTSTTLFSPQRAMSRGMFVTVLLRIQGDIPAIDIVTGDDGGSLDPNDRITREQMAAILYRYAKYAGCDVSFDENTNILSYEDALSISEYAVPAMQWACGAGIIQGSNNRLDPKGSATRAQVAAILERFIRLGVTQSK